ncbi:MAG: hypothetical protein HRT44_12775 [Bdellovibrionales bacterium]|nr:hypothetical protein [Bdellovibrionales bacterium]NQZ20111.1 hypothetical protein [Bdellovibrionales bacterium]
MRLLLTMIAPLLFALTVNAGGLKEKAEIAKGQKEVDAGIAKLTKECGKAIKVNWDHAKASAIKIDGREKNKRNESLW